MAEMGHTNTAMALAIYARSMSRSEDENRRLAALVDGGEVAEIGSWAGKAVLRICSEVIERPR